VISSARDELVDDLRQRVQLAARQRVEQPRRLPLGVRRNFAVRVLGRNAVR
jgi:hypothetical protein